LNNCYLCPNGEEPGRLNSETPFQDTCSELDTYLRYLPADLCESDRVDSIRRSDAFCECPGVKADCYMCDDDTNNVANPDRKVPFFEFLGSSFHTTCQDLGDFYTLYDTEDPEITTCDFVKIESRYCGCSSETDTSPVNACSLCPDAADPTEGDKLIDALDMTCNELQTYLSYVAADQCAMPWITDLQRFDYYCGCTAATAPCPICPDGSIQVSNPDAIVPYLIIPNNENPTCHQLATLGVIADPGELVLDDCSIFETQADFCGCPGAAQPTDGCDFCPDGSAPPNPDLVTPFGDTCQELSEYLSFLSGDQCTSDRVGFIQRQDFLCGCASATTQCALCEDHGSNDVAYPDRHIPLLSLPLNSNPSCQEVIEFMAVNDGDLSDAGCNALQSYAGYCGCPSTSPVNECSFCPNGGTPSNPDKVVSELFTCQGLYDFVSFLTSDGCSTDSNDFQQIQAFAYTCGCPNTQPSCTLCPDGAAPSNPDQLLADGETSCGEFSELVVTLTSEQCLQQASTIEGARSSCSCNGVSPASSSPACAIQQNADLCTTDLLASVPEQCDCYAFCDSTFVKCQSGEGGLLTSSECSGTPITGCNFATASSSASNPNADSAQQSDSGNRDDNTAVIAVAVVVPTVIALLVVVYYFFTRKSSVENDKMNAGLEAESEEAHLNGMEGSVSMSDVPMNTTPVPPPSSFINDSTPIAENPDSKVV